MFKFIKNKKTKNLALAIATFLCIASFCLGYGLIVGMGVGYANEAVLSSVSYQTSYNLGAELTIQPATIEYDGQTKTADKTIVFPDGRKYQLDTVSLSQNGKYKVVYSSVFDGKYIEKTVEFEVANYKYQVVGNGSVVYNQAYSFDNTPSISFHPGNADYDLEKIKKDDIDGLIVSLQKGDMFKYNKIIDLSNSGIYNDLITLNIIPSYIGKKDFTKLIVRLTDIYDESNFVEIVTNSGTGGTTQYDVSLYQVGFKGQATKGLNRWDMNVYSSPHIGGNHTALSFCGLPLDNRTIAEDNVSFSFDAQNKAFYVSGYHEGHLVAGNVMGTSIIMDLDNTDYFSDPWSGFTTGEVYLSVQAEAFNSVRATFAITDIYGEDDLSSNTFVDSQPPKLNVDLKGYSEKSLPNGEVNKKYKLFDVNAYDLYDKDCKVDLSVEYVSGSMPISVSVKDNAFIPKYCGRYKISYTASDRVGNVAEKTYYVDVKEENGNPITSSALNQEENYTVGTTVPLQNIVLNGGCGNLKTVVTVVCSADDSQTVMDYSDDLTIKLNKIGQYVVTYTVSDYIEQAKEFTYTINSLDTDLPVYIDREEVDALLPEFFISGYTYTLPTLDAYCYSTFNKYVPSVISADNGTINGNLFTPSETANKVVITYTATNDGKTSSINFEREIVNIFNEYGIDMSKLFIGENFTTKFTAINNNNYPTYTVSEDTNIKFINKLSAEDFSFAFRFSDITKINFERMTVVLTDSVDPKISVRANLYVSSKGVLTMNIGNSDIIYTLGNAYNNDILVNFSSTNCSIFVGSYNVFLLGNYDGQDFTGFPSEMIKFSIEFDGVYGSGVEMLAKKVCNQTLSDDTEDYSKPIVSVLDSPSGNYELGSIVYLPEAYAFDVISPFVTSFKVKVTGPSGQILNDTMDNVKANYPDGYSFKLEEFGNYQIVYTASDLNGNSVTKNVYLTVIDSQAPVIELSGKTPEKVRLNAKVKVSAMTATDTMTPEKEILKVVYVIGPDGSIIKLDHKLQFTATIKGVYKVYYMPQDQAGNYATLINYVICG